MSNLQNKNLPENNKLKIYSYKNEIDLEIRYCHNQTDYTQLNTILKSVKRRLEKIDFLFKQFPRDKNRISSASPPSMKPMFKHLSHSKTVRKNLVGFNSPYS